MKKFATLLVLTVTTVTICSSFMPKKNAVKDIEPIYLFGFSFSFADSTVYMTDIQLIDSAQIGSHGMLMKCGVFSDQMKNYLLQQGVNNPTCVIFYSPKKKETEKKMNKIMKRYEKKQLLWRMLTNDNFHFINSRD